MTTSDIQAEIEDLYGITISPSMVSKITDKVIVTSNLISGKKSFTNKQRKFIYENTRI